MTQSALLADPQQANQGDEPLSNTMVMGGLRLWPVVLLLSALGSYMAVMLSWPQMVRLPLLLWFLTVCTGMSFVRLLRLDQPAVTWTLAIAVSMALDTLVAMAVLYLGAWSPFTILMILIFLSIAGALLQLVLESIGIGRAPAVDTGATMVSSEFGTSDEGIPGVVTPGVDYTRGRNEPASPRPRR